MEGYVIRPVQATLTDAASILEVERASLGDSDYTPREALAALERPEHYAYVALWGKEVVGFCSCLRIWESGAPCLEVDMLGVAPEHRERGLGTALIRIALERARQEGISRARALVAVGNHASLKAFARAGMRPDGPARPLHVYTIQGFAPVPHLPDHWHAEGQEVFCDALAPQWAYRLYDGAGRLCGEAGGLLVHTLAYRGFWVETLEAASPEGLHLLLRHLVERAKALRLDEVGYLASEEKVPFSAEDLIFAGFPIAGTYYRLREVPI